MINEEDVRFMWFAKLMGTRNLVCETLLERNMQSELNITLAQHIIQFSDTCDQPLLPDPIQSEFAGQHLIKRGIWVSPWELTY